MIKRSQNSSLELNKEQILQLDYDYTWKSVNSEEFIELEQCYGQVAYSKYSYTVRRNGTREEPYYYIRIIESEDVDGVYSFFIAPAFKPEDEMAEKLNLEVKRNKAPIEKGNVVSIDDLPKPLLDHTNSIYDAKLKKRVPILPQAELKPTEEKTQKQVSVKKQPVGLTEEFLINNQDNNREEGKFHSSDFFSPHICTRLWVLGIGAETGWVWHMKEIDGLKKKEYYVRPAELTKTFWDIQYDRGGQMVTKAFLKKQFPQLENEILEHENLRRLKSSYDTANIEISCIIDSFLIKWR